MAKHLNALMHSNLKVHLFVLSVLGLLAIALGRKNEMMLFEYLIAWFGVVLLWIHDWYIGGGILKRVKCFSVSLLFVFILLSCFEKSRLSIRVWLELWNLFLLTGSYWLGLVLIEKTKRMAKQNVGDLTRYYYGSLRKTLVVDGALINYTIFLFPFLAVLAFSPLLGGSNVDDSPGLGVALLVILGPLSFIFFALLFYAIVIALPLGMVLSIVGWRYKWLWIPSLVLIYRLVTAKQITDVIEMKSKQSVIEGCIFVVGTMWALYRWFWVERKQWIETSHRRETN